MPKYDFSKVALQLYWNHTSAWVFSCKFAAFFQNTFSWKHLWVTACEFLMPNKMLLCHGLVEQIVTYVSKGIFQLFTVVVYMMLEL